jgi:IMP dehydrogenase
MHRPVSEIMTKEGLITAPEGTDLKAAEKILRQTKVEKLPVVDGDGKLIGLITYRDILQVTSYPNAGKDAFGRLRVGAAIGVTKICWTGWPPCKVWVWMCFVWIVHMAIQKELLMR